MLRAGSPSPDMTMQQCTDETTDKDMSTAMSPMGKEMCSKQDIQKTATGYVTDSVCGIAGVTIASHAEITGDFNSAYTVKSTVRSERGPAGGHDDDRGEVARRLQGRSEARRHRDARRHEDEHQGHGKAEGPDPEAEVTGLPIATGHMVRDARRRRAPHHEVLILRRRQRVRAKRGPMTGSAPSRRMAATTVSAHAVTPAPAPPHAGRPSGCRRA